MELSIAGCSSEALVSRMLRASQGMSEGVGTLRSMVGCGVSLYTNQSQRVTHYCETSRSFTAITTSVTGLVCEYETESAFTIW